MPYEAFVCPNCGAKIFELDRATFCDSCGTNLQQYRQIKKKTFYEREDYCPNCKSVKWVLKDGLRIVHRMSPDGDYRDYSERYSYRQCLACGQEWDFRDKAGFSISPP